MSFDDYAKTWDTDKRINRAKIIAKKIRNSIDIDENDSAMEFGCGTGLISFNLYDKFKSIALIDSSKGMIDILNSKINKYKVTNMFAHHLDISSGNSLNMKFDVIYTSMVLHHINNTKAIINTLHQLLNKNGYLCIVDLDEEDGSFHKEYPYFDGHNGFNQDDLKDILINSGFSDIESNTFFYDDKIVKDEKVNYSLFLMKARKY
ncbi:class I SAM-dependent methyltransferase [Clostridium bowmanii]|uniref:class I SAM-dependent DNA methyltransferase n=1 Tax=Clostridium bowmanii TaxID=132925 RepID=UPI001C0C7077|nr:class I SAM-dependent methyltransferase [Clostridium bowmanii]MBU3191840.1 class I SAM-dependent methyltransferase [Clostridium bowmanii]MCA1076170.1 class I SAM-dependent methyltransferase [Clostridium bowmanii]